MKHLKLILILIMLPMIGFSEEVPFFKGSVASVKTKAKAEGKLYILDFYADWCTPCKFMEENTYSNPQVLEYFKTSYIPVKVDIDDFDGFALKNQFNVNVLPTIMIFDANGVLIERYEEAMAPTQFLEILEKFEYKKGSPQLTVTAPSIDTDLGIDVLGVPSPTYSAPVVEPTPYVAPVIESTPEVVYETTPVIETPVYVAPTNDYTSVGGEDLTPVNDNLYEFSSRKPDYQGYGVQVGLYAQYGNVLREVERFQEIYQEPIMVNISNHNDRTVYRLLIGNFKSSEEAQVFKSSVKDNGLADAFVKDLKALN